jgi:hypothetical protein
VSTISVTIPSFFFFWAVVTIPSDLAWTSEGERAIHPGPRPNKIWMRRTRSKEQRAMEVDQKYSVLHLTMTYAIKLIHTSIDWFVLLSKKTTPSRSRLEFLPNLTTSGIYIYTREMEDTTWDRGDSLRSRLDRKYLVAAMDAVLELSPMPHWRRRVHVSPWLQWRSSATSSFVSSFAGMFSPHIAPALLARVSGWTLHHGYRIRGNSTSLSIPNNKENKPSCSLEARCTPAEQYASVASICVGGTDA